MDDIIKDFLVESLEGLDQLERDFVELEKYPDDNARLANIFRCIHTIKGTCGFLGFSKLETVTHRGENLLSKLRDGALELDPDITSALLSLVDATRSIMACIEEDGTEGNVDFSDLIDLLARLHDGEAPASTTAAISVDTPASTTPDDIESMELPTERRHDPRSVGDRSIRVDVDLLDQLMNLVGELVLARNQVLQFSAHANNPLLNATSQRLNLITSELQEGVMKTRMQPIGNVWSKFPRVARDLAVACNKKVRVQMEGKGTELDKTLIEAIKDPLTHIVRNAIDHGLESPQARRQAGKDETGVLQLRAYHEGGQVNIEINDDGGGIDPSRVLEKALKRGVLTAEQASRMSDRDIVNLIFMPGFSTADQVTNISGRGVGMDVVRSNIEKIGGTVDINSAIGMGTRLRIRIPLTLAIIPALIVRSAGDRYALPQVSLLELVRLEGETARSGIETVHGVPVYRLRGNLLPLVYLDRELKVSRPEASDDSVLNIVVLQADDQSFGLVVDEITDTEEIVVKPLSKQLKGLQTFAGATIMGDGSVALILDVTGLAAQAGVIGQTRPRLATTSESAQSDRADDHQTMLLFSVGHQRRIAIPLSMVARLEEFDRSRIENSSDMEVVQYRGRILPLISLRRLLGISSGENLTEGDEPIQVVVYSKEGSTVGLVVDQIVDIIEDKIRVQRRNGRGGIVGSAVIGDHVTDLLDVGAALDAAQINLYSDVQTLDVRPNHG
ncbi:MAG: chemotaxis protein CheW [Myxococcota bacterium]